MKKAVAILLVAVMALTFAACGKKTAIVGTWADENHQSLTFRKNGTGTFTEYGTEYPLSYRINGNKITIEMDDESIEYTFRISGKTLTLTYEGETITFTKK